MVSHLHFAGASETAKPLAGLSSLPKNRAKSVGGLPNQQIENRFATPAAPVADVTPAFGDGQSSAQAERDSWIAVGFAVSSVIP
jgi:hypothetical protein